MIVADLALARRLEAAEAANGVECALSQDRLQPHSGAAFQGIAGGWAVFVGPESPLTEAIGLGLAGPVREADLLALEAFYGGRGAAVGVDLCPLADASLLELLRERRYRISEFNNTLVRRLSRGEEIAAERAVRRAGAAEAELWARTVGQGFLERRELTPAEMDIGRIIFHIDGALCYLAGGAEPGAAAAMSIRHGLALLFGDSTIPAFRRKGLQAALIRGRLAAAVAAGCNLASASTAPGSASQRNYERMGFQVAYTKVTLVR
jgi:hypothetical protein